MEENKDIVQEQPINLSEMIDDETAQKLGDASLTRIKQIAKMSKEYYRAIYGNINSNDFYQLGMDTIVAGFTLISRSMDMDELNVEERIALMNSTLTTIISMLNKVYLNPEVVANQVAQAALKSAQRAGKFNGKRK